MISPTDEIKVMKPEDMNSAFAYAFNSGSIELLLALYEPDSILMDLTSQRVQGMDGIRTTLAGLLQLQGRMVSTNIYCLPFENIALLRAHFILHTVGEDGTPSQIEGHTSEIVRKQPDNRWLYIVDHPFGADPLQMAGT